LKRTATMSKTVEEAEHFLSKKTRSASPRKSAPKRAASPKKEKAPKKQKKETKEAKKVSPKSKAASKIKRQGTMAVTTAEGEKFIEKEGGVEEKRTGKEDNEDEEKEDKSLKRQSTMAVTASEGEKFIQKEEDKKKKASPKKSPRKKIKTLVSCKCSGVHSKRPNKVFFSNIITSTTSSRTYSCRNPFS